MFICLLVCIFSFLKKPIMNSCRSVEYLPEWLDRWRFKQKSACSNLNIIYTFARIYTMTTEVSNHANCPKYLVVPAPWAWLSSVNHHARDPGASRMRTFCCYYLRDTPETVSHKLILYNCQISSPTGPSYNNYNLNFSLFFSY